MTTPTSIRGDAKQSDELTLGIEKLRRAISVSAAHGPEDIVHSLMIEAITELRAYASSPVDPAGDGGMPPYSLTVPVGGGAVMFVPNPRSDPHIEWSLRYARDLNNPDAGRFSAAACIESFDYLLSSNINMTEATRRLRIMRAAIKQGNGGAA